MEPQTQQPQLANREPTSISPYQPPVTKKRTKKVMFGVAAFMVVGALLIAAISYALTRAADYIEKSDQTHQRSAAPKRQQVDN